MGFSDWFGDVYEKPKPKHSQDFYNKIITLPIKVIHEPKEEELKQKNIVVVKDSLSENPNLYRPLTFENYIGQGIAKDYLKRIIEGTKKRNKPFPHTLISSPPGFGKTTLAKIIARELNKSFQEVLSARIESLTELFEVFENANGGVIFLDEVHAIERKLVEPLYPIMEDFRFEGKAFQPFTLIGATTDKGLMIEPFLDRFKAKIELEPYKLEDIYQIIKNYQRKAFPIEIIKEDAFREVAMNCRFTPRIGIGLLESTIYLEGDYQMALTSAGILKDGFTKKDREYLDIVSRNEKGIGLNAISSTLMIAVNDVAGQIEPYLLKNKMIISTKTGRKITDEGKTLLEQLKTIK